MVNGKHFSFNTNKCFVNKLKYPYGFQEMVNYNTWIDAVTEISEQITRNFFVEHFETTIGCF